MKKGAPFLISGKSEPVDVNCTYEIQSLPNGSKLLVIKTYSSHSRNAGIFQTIHFTKEFARKLIDIFKQEFNI